MASSGNVGTRSMASSGSNSTPHDYCFKVVLCGDTGVGKTSLVHRYTHNVFTTVCGGPTIGAIFATAIEKVEQHEIELQLWDVAGVERLRDISAMHLRGARAVILCFDVTNATSFESLVE